MFLAQLCGSRSTDINILWQKDFLIFFVCLNWLLFSHGRVGWEMDLLFPSARWDYDEDHYMGWEIRDVCRCSGKCLMGQGQLCHRVLVPLQPSWWAQEHKIQTVSSLKIPADMCCSSNACCASSAGLICMCAPSPAASGQAGFTLCLHCISSTVPIIVTHHEEMDSWPFHALQRFLDFLLGCAGKKWMSSR